MTKHNILRLLHDHPEINCIAPLLLLAHLYKLLLVKHIILTKKIRVCRDPDKTTQTLLLLLLLLLFIEKHRQP